MATSAAWSPAPKTLKLAENELHVWRARLLGRDATSHRFEPMLSEEEKRRAAKFLVVEAKEHFTVGRGILRELIGRYTGLGPSEITLGYGPYGKPFFNIDESSGPVRFNVSHSHGYGAFVFACKCEVGIDIEQVRPEAAGDELAKRFFSKREIEQLSAMTAGEIRTEGFFKCWTKKEAYIKARGEGLQIPLHSFSVAVADEEAEGLVGADGSCWSLYPFEPAAGFVGAVAAQGKDWRLQFWDWQESGA